MPAASQAPARLRGCVLCSDEVFNSSVKAQTCPRARPRRTLCARRSFSLEPRRAPRPAPRRPPPAPVAGATRLPGVAARRRPAVGARQLGGLRCPGAAPAEPLQGRLAAPPVCPAPDAAFCRCLQKNQKPNQMNRFKSLCKEYTSSNIMKVNVEKAIIISNFIFIDYTNIFRKEFTSSFTIRFTSAL